MPLNSRILFAAAVAAFAIATGTMAGAMPGSQKQCKPDLVEALGAYGKTKAIAQKAGISAWGNQVTSLYGSQWASWAYATNKSFDCFHPSRHPNMWRCAVKARPCRYVQTNHSYEPRPQFRFPRLRTPRRPGIRPPIVRGPRLHGAPLRSMPMRGMSIRGLLR